MIPNAIKLLIFVVVIWSVKARPDFELKAVEEKIVNKDPKMDEIVENDQKFKVPYFKPKTNKLVCVYGKEDLKANTKNNKTFHWFSYPKFSLKF